MQENNILKISTSGSVDDGKSTLIGRILYDTNSLKRDQLEAIEKNSKQKGYDYLDFSLATDGLVAERKQGITIDVAHIYFSTEKRSFIIADTPGHKEYTRNMITGTSNSEISLILIDARNGVIEQTKRHFFINNLLRLENIVVVVNKMDLINYDENKFHKIVEDFMKLTELASYKTQKIHFIPISALHGENVVESSEKLSWYKGKTLLQFLEEIQIQPSKTNQSRFQIQNVIRPKTEKYHDFRGYAGKLKGGELKVGDKITVLPSQTNSKIKDIYFYNQTYKKAHPGSSITITLEDDVQIDRGDMIVKQDELPLESKQIKAVVCWMNQAPLEKNSFYWLQHGVKTVKSKITDINSKIDIDQMGKEQQTENLKLNDLGQIELRLAQPLYFDDFKKNKDLGSFILIDMKSNTTAGVGFFQENTLPVK